MAVAGALVFHEHILFLIVIDIEKYTYAMINASVQGNSHPMLHGCLKYQIPVCSQQEPVMMDWLLWMLVGVLGYGRPVYQTYNDPLGNGKV